MSTDTGRHHVGDAYVDGEAAGDMLHDRVSAASRPTDVRNGGGELREAAGPRRRPSTITAVLLAIAALAVGVALAAPRFVGGDSVPSSPPEVWNGDWKDGLVEDGAQSYSGDWKDALGDEEGARGASTGDWKDLLVD